MGNLTRAFRRKATTRRWMRFKRQVHDGTLNSAHQRGSRLRGSCGSAHRAKPYFEFFTTKNNVSFVRVFRL